MTISAEPGPIIVFGQLPPIQVGSAPPDYNPDAGPSFAFAGMGLLDLRYGYKIGGAGNQGSSPLLAVGFAPGLNYAVVDQVPSAASTSNLAALQNVVNGTPMVLTAGVGATLTTAAQFFPQTGLTVPAGVLALDGIPGILTFGQNAAVGVVDPTKSLSRAIAVATANGGTGGNILIRGYDLYGNPLSQLVAAVNNSTVNTLKAFKFIASATPQFTDAHNYSLGIADVYGLPLRADNSGYVYANFNNSPVTAPGFVAAVTTNPATNLTGDVRGTITSTSDGVKRLQIMQGVSPANLTSSTGTFGVAQA